MVGWLLGGFAAALVAAEALAVATFSVLPVAAGLSVVAAAACFKAQCPFLPQWWQTSVFLALLLARAEEPLSPLFSFSLLGFSGFPPFPFPFPAPLPFPLSPFFPFSFVFLVTLPSTERAGVTVVVLPLEVQHPKLLVVELKARQHCSQTTGGLVQQEVPFSILVKGA